MRNFFWPVVYGVRERPVRILSIYAYTDTWDANGQRNENKINEK